MKRPLAAGNSPAGSLLHGTTSGTECAFPIPAVPDHELIRIIGSGSYGDVWLARNIMGASRAVKVLYERRFQDRRPYEREFSGIQKFEPISRTHPGLVNILQIGRNDKEGYFYYVMELADGLGKPREPAAIPIGTTQSVQPGNLKSPSASDSYRPHTLRAGS